MASTRSAAIAVDEGMDGGDALMDFRRQQHRMQRGSPDGACGIRDGRDREAPPHSAWFHAGYLLSVLTLPAPRREARRATGGQQRQRGGLGYGADARRRKLLDRHQAVAPVHAS